MTSETTIHRLAEQAISEMEEMAPRGHDGAPGPTAASAANAIREVRDFALKALHEGLDDAELEALRDRQLGPASGFQGGAYIDLEQLLDDLVQGGPLSAPALDLRLRKH